MVALSVAALCACHFALLGLTGKKKKNVLLLLLASSFFLNSFYKNEPNATEKKILPERWWYETEMRKVNK